ncbi:MAG: adenosine deaminase, partial [Acidobacteriota bacterium]
GRSALTARPAPGARARGTGRTGRAGGGTAYRTFVRAMPKAEIHLHLEGTVDPATLALLAERRGRRLGTRERLALASLYRHRDFPHFLENFRAVCSRLRGPEDFALIAGALSERLRRQNMRYAEVLCSPGIFERAGLSAVEIMDAVSGAARRRQEAAGGPTMRFLFDGVRQWGARAMEDLVLSAGRCRRYDVIGVGVGGDERSVPASDLAPAFEEARRLGLRTTAHAGEFDGPRSVWEALDRLGVERIGHGIRASEDPELVRRLARHATPLECCPTSNLRTGVVRAWSEHPLPALLRSGVAVTVNSDDPALFGTSLCGEWMVLRTRLGLEPEQVLEVGVRTARATFLPEDDRSALVAEMIRAGRRLREESA